MSTEQKRAKSISLFLKGQAVFATLLAQEKMDKPEYDKAVILLAKRLNIATI